MRYRLLDVCELANDKIETTYLNKHNYISTENMLPNKGGIEIASSLPKASRVRAFRKKDVLVSNIRPYFKKIWYADRDGGCSSDVLVFRAKECIRPQYLYYLLSENAFFSYAMSTAKGTKMPRGDKKALMKYSLSGFPLDYQDKIVNVLKPLDDKININTKINKNLAGHDEEEDQSSDYCQDDPQIILRICTRNTTNEQTRREQLMAA